MTEVQFGAAWPFGSCERRVRSADGRILTCGFPLRVDGTCTSRNEHLAAALPSRSSCDGRHVCDPPSYPTELGQTWDCPECGAHHQAFDVHEAYAGNPLHVRMLQHVRPGTLGWRTKS